MTSGLRAVVLVGGEGTRLRPLTATRPKQMLPILRDTMLERVLSHLAAHGVVEVVLSLGYKPDAFLEAFPTGEAAGVRLRYAVEPYPLDTAGAIRFAAIEAGYHTGDEPFLVVNGDVLTGLDVGALVRFHRGRSAEATIALTQVDDPSAFGVVPTDDEGRVLAFVEKPPRHEAPTDWINAGTYVLQPDVLDRIAPETRVSIERETFPAIASDRRLFAVHSPAYWIDAGTPASYLRAHLDLVGEGSLVAESALVDPRAHVERSSLGDNVVVARNARVVRSVLLPGALVGEGAEVVDSVLGEGARVGKGAKVHDLTVVADHAEVPDGATVIGGRVGR